jgi:hypothetical protein
VLRNYYGETVAESAKTSGLPVYIRNDRFRYRSWLSPCKKAKTFLADSDSLFDIVDDGDIKAVQP